MSKSAQIWLVGSESLQCKLAANVHISEKVEQITPPVTAVILSTPLDKDWFVAVKSLRSHSKLLYVPLFYQGSVPSIYRSLFDGPVDGNLLTCAKSITQRLDLVSPEIMQSANLEMKILSYLFSRSNLSIEGRLSHTAPHVCEYPLVQALGVGNDFNARKLLQEMVQRNVLEHSASSQIFYTCGACDSGLLNFQQCCPQCHSENYKTDSLVHCYSCGKIGPVPEFLRQSRLICSHCSKPLKDEGIDYDKPKENKHCSGCDYYFSRPVIKIFCLVCNHSCRVKDLEKKQLNAYTLSRRGEYLIRGIEKQMYKYFNTTFKVIDYIEFSRIVNWQIQLSGRYTSVYFSIMNIHFNYDIKYASAKEIEMVEGLMGKLFTNLKSVLRESDLSTRLDGNLFFLLPMTDNDGASKLISRVQTIISANKDKVNVPDLKLQLSCIASQNILGTVEKNSNNILMELQKQTRGQQQFYLKD